MRKRFTKSILVGAFAVVVSAIVVGPAFGGGSPPSQQVQQSKFVPGYTDFPNFLRLQDEAKASFVPGYTDFPNALRLHSTLTPTERKQLDAAVARSNSKTSFVPGYSDFPNVLRLHNTLTATERKELTAVAATTSVSSSSGNDFSWSDAGVGIGIGLAIAGGLALLAVFGSRRGKATPATA
jgi:hypothetical protein